MEQFLRGKDDEIIAELTKHMQQASEELRFEDAARLRDQISALRSLQQKQHAEQLRGRFGDFDALSVRSHAELACVYVLMVRRGKVLVGTHYFFRAPVFDTERQLLPAFIAHYYLKHRRELPTEILVPFDWPGREELAHQIGDHCGVRLRIAAGVRGMRKGMAGYGGTELRGPFDQCPSQKIHRETTTIRSPDHAEFTDASGTHRVL